jgi:ribosomal-protein-alanine N-acetyltransferase
MAKKDSCYVYGVFESRTGRLVGVVDIMVMCRGHHQMGNLGYRIFNQYWRQGFATEAVKIVMKKAFVELRLHRLEASADTGNQASIALARSLGLHDEGTRCKYIFDRGAWRDHRVFVALPETVGLRAKPPRLK